ncbi:MAG: Ig-like domain-containing protein [Prevotellaceae bacterium]|jgi:uncharacterized protein YjdB|nr:Ig-like domain-containing protein [Prevotellaceae bacterium]
MKKVFFNKLYLSVMNMYKNRMIAVALMILAIAFGTQSCSDDAPEYVKVTGITVTPDNTVLMVNDNITLVATVFPRLATDKSVIWQSDSTSVATVDDNGVVTAHAEGVANISVTSVGNNEKVKTCAVTVVTTFDVVLSANTLLVPLGSASTLEATIIPSSISQEVTWASDNTEVATVDDGGIITGVLEGTAKITATSVVDASRIAECEVTVIAFPTPVGVWTFEDAANLVHATIGEDLEAAGEIVSIDGPNGTKAVKTEYDSYFTIHHNIGANGGGEYTNEYTLMMDIRSSAEEFAEWVSVFNSGGEGILWINGDGMIGFAPLGGYSETGLTPDTWHRVIIAVKLGESLKIYIDGVHVFTSTQGNEVDGMMSLYPDVVYIGYDTSGYAGPNFAEVRMWDVQLTDEQAKALGRPN